MCPIAGATTAGPVAPGRGRDRRGARGRGRRRLGPRRRRLLDFAVGAVGAARRGRGGRCRPLGLLPGVGPPGLGAAEYRPGRRPDEQRQGHAQHRARTGADPQVRGRERGRAHREHGHGERGQPEERGWPARSAPQRDAGLHVGERRDDHRHQAERDQTDAETQRARAREGRRDGTAAEVVGLCAEHREAGVRIADPRGRGRWAGCRWRPRRRCARWWRTRPAAAGPRRRSRSRRTPRTRCCPWLCAAARRAWHRPRAGDRRAHRASRPPTATRRGRHPERRTGAAS